MRRFSKLVHHFTPYYHITIYVRANTRTWSKNPYWLDWLPALIGGTGRTELRQRMEKSGWEALTIAQSDATCPLGIATALACLLHAHILLFTLTTNSFAVITLITNPNLILTTHFVHLSLTQGKLQSCASEINLIKRSMLTSLS